MASGYQGYRVSVRPVESVPALVSKQLLESGYRHFVEGRLHEAAIQYKQLLDIDPENFHALHMLGLTLHGLGRSEEAIDAILRALKINPRSAEACNNLGNVLYLSGRSLESIPYFVEAISLRPDFFQAHNSLGKVLHETGREEEAIAQYFKSVAIEPNYAEALLNIGISLRGKRNFSQAADYYRRVLVLQPLDAVTHNSFGSMLFEMGRLADAEHHYRQALVCQPVYPIACNNLGNVLLKLGEFDESRTYFQRAIEQAPDFAGAHWGLSHALLASGDFARGWDEFGWRLKEYSQFSRPFSFPLWQGEPLREKTLLVWGEQGLGDEIMYASALPDVMKEAKHCVLECEPRLVSLFARSFPGVDVVARENPPYGITRREDIDFQMPAGDLPRWFRKKLEDFPVRGGYLKADPEREAYWKERLDELGAAPRVGIAWRSMKRGMERDMHYTSLSQWEAILRVPGVSFINLQYDECREELEEARTRFGVKIHELGGLNLKDELDQVAALMKGLDLVISAGTSVVGLGGALGVPVWMYTLDYNWTQLGTDHLPWMPSVKLYPKSWDEPWEPVLEWMGEDLSAWAAGEAVREKRPEDRRSAHALENELSKAVAYSKAGEWPGVERVCRKMLEMQPAHPDALHLLGVALFMKGERAESLALIEKAIAARPDDPAFYNSLGNMLREQGRYSAAYERYQKALEIDPNFASALGNLGDVLKKTGRYAEAAECFRKILKSHPDYGTAHRTLGTCLLSQGDLAQGWQELAWRFRAEQDAVQVRPFPHAPWRGEDLAGKCVLVWGEQGLGDELMYAGALPDLMRVAKRVLLECDSRLVGLFARSFPGVEVVGRTNPPQPRLLEPGVDCQTPAGSLSRCYRPALESFPRHHGYLSPDPERVTHWKAWLESLGSGPKVGIAWRSMNRGAGREPHYTELEQWGEILKTPGIIFVNLQYDECREELAEVRRKLGVDIHEPPDIRLRDDLDEVVALTKALDLVISAGTSVIGMAGAVGAPAWMFTLEGNWTQLGTDHLPWMPSVKIYSKSWEAPWAPVLQRIAGDLERWIGNGKKP